VSTRDLAKFIKIKDNGFLLSYKPPTVGTNMREEYRKEVINRIYGY
jgi:hypothetical protein